MLKKLTAILFSLVIGITLFSGCSCSGDPLSFDRANGFNGGEKPSAVHTEKLIYDVTFSETDDYYKKDALLKDNVKLEFTDGRYISEFKVLGSVSSVDSDILAIDGLSEIYSLSTEFSIKFKISSENDSKEHVDTITTKVYFAPQGYSFAPIYSETETDCLIPRVNDTDFIVYRAVSTYVVKYNMNGYESTLRSAYLSGENIDKDVSEITFDEKTTKEKAEFRKYIDNAQLLFALRNIRLTEKSNFSLPVLSESYGKPQTLSVTNESALERDITIKLNGTTYSEKIKYDALSYRISSTNSAGLKQYVQIQSAKSDNIPDYALPIRYARAVTLSHSSYNYPVTGTLIFDLAEAEITNG